MVVNGVGQAAGEQDTEDTELMAVYTKENQGGEKVQDARTLQTPNSPFSSH